MANALKACKDHVQFVFVVLVCLLVSSGVTSGQEKTAELESTVQQKKEAGKVYPVPPPLVYQGLYPCQACHRNDIRGVSGILEKRSSFLGKYIRLPDPKPRTLVRMHRNVNLKHAEWHWCLNCHSTYERNYLKLMTGEEISFEESYRLCGQCHGTIYRDWKLGIHGRRVGQWDGKKLYLLCAHCHDPHKPKFRKLPGMPSPQPPSYGRWAEMKAHKEMKAHEKIKAHE